MAKLKPILTSDETLDTVLNGKISIIQDRKGYRFSIDALLLAHFALINNARQIVDLGAGSGVVGMILADLHPKLKVVGLELQQKMVDRGSRSAALNGFDDRLTMIEGDVRAIDAVLARESFDGAVANPPYRAATTGRISPGAEKRLARHEITANLADFVRAAAYAVRRGGNLAVVYPAHRLVDLLEALRRGGFEPKRLRLVHSFADSKAALALAEGVKGGRPELLVLPPLTIYGDRGKYTAAANAMLAGSRSRKPS